MRTTKFQKSLRRETSSQRNSSILCYFSMIFIIEIEQVRSVVK